MGMLQVRTVTLQKALFVMLPLFAHRALMQFKKYIWKRCIRILQLHTTLQKLISVHNGINVHPGILQES